MREESCFGHVIFEVYMKSPKDELLLQAEHKRNQGGFIFKGRFVEAIREMLVRWGSFGYSLVEMAFVVG